MKFLKNYTRFLEALDPSQFREYMKVWDENPELKTRYESIFKKYEGDKNHYRIYIPLINSEKFENDREVSEVEEGLADFLSDYDYSIVDYMKGTCKKDGAKNTSKIGQVLTRIERDDSQAKGYMKDFVEDPVRKVGGVEDKLVVISRHPYDIAGADTDRGWSNCMTLANYNPVKANPIYDEMNIFNKELFALKSQIHKIRTKRSSTNDGESDRLRNEMSTLQSQVNTISDKIHKLQNKLNELTNQGQNAHYLIEDVKEGSLIAYLVKNTDKDVKNPIANLNIKPYINQMNDKDFVLVSDSSMYGQGSKRFKATVDAWLDEVNVDKKGLYCINKNIYDDSDYGIVRKNISKEEESKMLNDALSGSKTSFTLLNSVGLLDDKNKWNNLDDDLKFDLIERIVSKNDELKSELEDGDYDYYWSDVIILLIGQSLGIENKNIVKTLLECANDEGCDMNDIIYDIIFPSDYLSDNPALVEGLIEYYGGFEDLLSSTDLISNGSNEVFYEIIKNINVEDFKKIGIKIIDEEYYLYLSISDDDLKQTDSDNADYTLSNYFDTSDCDSIFKLYKKRKVKLKVKLTEKVAKVKKPNKNKE